MDKKENILKEIRNKKLFVLEGKDDVGFFTKLLNAIGVKDYYVWAVEGKDNYKEKIKVLSKVSGFSNLTHLAVIRDKESDNALASIQGILSGMGMQNIPQHNGDVAEGKLTTGIFILPGIIQGKMLEDLCLEIVRTEPAMKCVNEFEQCISTLRNPPKNKSKARMLAYLASRQEPVNSIGIAAEKGYWDMSSPVLEELRSFLKKFI